MKTAGEIRSSLGSENPGNTNTTMIVIGTNTGVKDITHLPECVILRRWFLEHGYHLSPEH